MSAVHLNRRDLENHDAVALVIKDGLGRVLTLYHAKFDFWTLPLGKAEPDQDVEQAAIAEAYEECGIKVRELRRVCTGTRVYHYEGRSIVTFFTVFELMLFEGEPTNREPDKHPLMRFMTLEELKALPVTSDGTAMFIEHLAQLDQDVEVLLPDPDQKVANCRIGLSGASGAGKTTFARYLQARYGGLIHDGSVRQWLARHEKRRYATLSDEQFVELQQHLMEQYETSDANIFDRSPLDSIVYAKRVSHLMDFVQFRLRAIDLLRSFDVIVFFAPYSPFLKPDGVRIAELTHQTEMASRIFLEGVEIGLGDKIVVYDHSQPMAENARRTLQRAGCSMP